MLICFVVLLFILFDGCCFLLFLFCVGGFVVVVFVLFVLFVCVFLLFLLLFVCLSSFANP